LCCDESKSRPPTPRMCSDKHRLPLLEILLSDEQIAPRRWQLHHKVIHKMFSRPRNETHVPKSSPGSWPYFIYSGTKALPPRCATHPCRPSRTEWALRRPWAAEGLAPERRTWVMKGWRRSLRGPTPGQAHDLPPFPFAAKGPPILGGVLRQAISGMQGHIHGDGDFK
jgi:hypothetical protein